MRKREIIKFNAEFSELLNEAETSVYQQARRHLKFGQLTTYIRIGRRIVPMRIGRRYVQDADVVMCVQIASVNLPEKLQRKGIFTQMLAQIMSLTDMPIYVESILNKDFGDALMRRGFLKVREQEHLFLPDMMPDLVLLRESH